MHILRFAGPFAWSMIISTVLHAQTSSARASAQLQQGGSTESLGSTSAPRPNNTVSPSVAPEDLANLRLEPGSLVDIHVFEEADLDGTYRLDDHGQISIPLAGAVNLQSLNLAEAESAVRAKLEAEQILKSPHVTLDINQYSARNIVVTGEVSSPGRYPVLGGRQLIDVLAMAGGQTALAGNEILIHRFNQPQQVSETVRYGRGLIEPAAVNVTINPGDSVLVKRAGVVYVLGAVNRPGGYVMQEDGELDVAQALALAAGTAAEAKIGEMRVIRKQPGGNPQEIRIHYKKIRDGQLVPLKLMAEDIIYVPTSAIKSVLFRGTQVIASAASATIYTVN